MRLTYKLRIASSVALSASLLLAGCAVGPNFKSPAPPNVPGYTPAPLSSTGSTPYLSGEKAQQFVPGRDIPGDWWALFHSAPLNNLIERSLKANPDIKAAQAALVVARENVQAQRGAYYPNVSAGFSASRQQTSSQVSPVPNASIFNFGSTRQKWLCRMCRTCSGSTGAPSSR